MDDEKPLTQDEIALNTDAELSAAELTMIANGALTRVHRAGTCAGEYCWVHKPSPHHMLGWPVAWRGDKSTAERICPHGVGHPDPDDLAYNQRLGRDVSIHACDGCCALRGDRDA